MKKPSPKNTLERADLRWFLVIKHHIHEVPSLPDPHRLTLRATGQLFRHRTRLEENGKKAKSSNYLCSCD